MYFNTSQRDIGIIQHGDFILQKNQEPNRLGPGDYTPKPSFVDLKSYNVYY